MIRCSTARASTFRFRPQFDAPSHGPAAVARSCSPHAGRAIIDRLNQFARAHKVREFSIFFRGQLLELARQVAAHANNLPGDGNTFSDAQVRAAFFKAALIASGLWGRRVFGHRLADRALSTSNFAARSVRSGRASRSQRRARAGIALGRAWLLFGKYLPARYAGFGDAFQRATGITLKQYFVCATWILRHSFPDADDGGTFSSEVGTNHTVWGKIFATFLGKLSQDPESLAASVGDNDQTGYRSLRERPILTFSGGRSIILDPTFYTDIITTSPLFHAAKGADKPLVLFAAFGDAFEDYAIDLLKARYPAIKGLPGEVLRPRIPGQTSAGEQFEVDAILNVAPSLVIMEIKASFIRGHHSYGTLRGFSRRSSAASTATSPAMASGLKA